MTTWVLIAWVTGSGLTMQVDFASKEKCLAAIAEMQSVAGGNRPWAVCADRGNFEQEEQQ